MLRRTQSRYFFIAFFITILVSRLKCCLSEDVPDPVALFPLNSLHTTKDISNSHLTAGTAVGVSLAPGPDGKPGGSYYFPGSANSYIEIPHQTKLDTRYSITLLAWIYNEGTEGPIIIYDPSPQSNSWAVHMWISTGPSELYVRLIKRNELSNNAAVKNDMGSVNTWRYVGYTYDYNTGKQILFVDGVNVKERISDIQEIATNYKVRIGGVAAGDSRAFKGRISCVQIYDKALTTTQIQAVKNICDEKNVPLSELYSACSQYTAINDPTRATVFKISGQSPDRQAFNLTRWYRLKSKVGTRIATSCPATGSCGSQFPGWLNGQYPSLETGIKKMKICYRTGSNCCGSNATVYVRQCYGYPVFMFVDAQNTSPGNRICTEKGPENAFPDIMFQSSSERCLSFHVMYTETNVIDASTCINYCLNAGDKCKSINYMTLKSSTCQLNNGTMTDYPQHATVNDSCIYYQRTEVMSYTIT